VARSLWKGAISFGLVHIPVELYSAVKENELDLTMLDRRDFAPVGFKRYNKQSGQEVGWDNIVKGYEYSDGEFVVLSDEDLRRANVQATQSIDILAFVHAEEVPLVYYEQPYYLAPARGGDKVYALLRETLRQAGKIGIANVVMRTKQHLCALVCIGEAIVLNTLRYHDEIRAADDLKLPAATPKAAGISDKELQMALSLVDGMTEAWQPEQYRDTYRDDILALVERKVAARQTKTITAAAPEKRQAASGNVIDLVALLRQSLGKKPGAARADGAGESDDEAPAPAPVKARKPAARKAAPKAPVAKPRARAPAASRKTG
jgi:DNA end-binding protein Ku